MKNIYLRKANENDMEDIFSWRNDEETRKVSFHSDPVTLEVHKDWFKKSLKDPNRFMYIAENNIGNKIGMTRFDIINSQVAEISINISPEMRRKGFASDIICMTCSEIQQNKFISLIIARTKEENKPSIKVFAKADFFQIFIYRDLKYGEICVLGKIIKGKANH